MHCLVYDKNIHHTCYQCGLVRLSLLLLTFSTRNSDKILKWSKMEKYTKKSRHVIMPWMIIWFSYQYRYQCHAKWWINFMENGILFPANSQYIDIAKSLKKKENTTTTIRCLLLMKKIPYIFHIYWIQTSYYYYYCCRQLNVWMNENQNIECKIENWKIL